MEITIYQIAILAILPMLLLGAYLFTKFIEFVERHWDE